MRTFWRVTALLLLLTAPYWLGFLAGLWHQRVYAGIVRRRGLWLLLQWPFRQVARGIRWLFHWCPQILGVLLVGAGLCAFVLVSTALHWLTDAPAPVGHTRFVQGLVEMPGAGQIAWQLGDTEAIIRNTRDDALQCSSNRQSLYGGNTMFVPRGAVLRIPAETFLAGVYCGGLHATTAQSVGIRVGPAPYPTPPGFVR
jgi:hypothetical protein